MLCTIAFVSIDRLTLQEHTKSFCDHILTELYNHHDMSIGSKLWPRYLGRKRCLIWSEQLDLDLVSHTLWILALTPGWSGPLTACLALRAVSKACGHISLSFNPIVKSWVLETNLDLPHLCFDSNNTLGSGPICGCTFRAVGPALCNGE